MKQNLNVFYVGLFMETVKKCKICGIEKAMGDFPKHIHYKDNLDSRCRACIKEQTQLRKTLKKTAPAMPERCECCGEVPVKSLVLDHCHTTNTFRGWICEPCNTGIGKLGDDFTGVWLAAMYLSRCNLETLDKT